jgi:hypothetical protein
VYGLDGSLERIIQWNGPDLSLDPERVAEAAAAYFDDISAGRRYDLPIPDGVPGFGRLLVDSRDRLWVSDYAQYLRDPLNWTVFSPEGRAVARFEAPERFHLMAIDGDRVLARLKNALDVETVAVYEIR